MYFVFGWKGKFPHDLGYRMVRYSTNLGYRTMRYLTALRYRKFKGKSVTFRAPFFVQTFMHELYIFLIVLGQLSSIRAVVRSLTLFYIWIRHEWISLSPSHLQSPMSQELHVGPKWAPAASVHGKIMHKNPLQIKINIWSVRSEVAWFEVSSRSLWITILFMLMILVYWWKDEYFDYGLMAAIKSIIQNICIQ